MGYHKWGIAGKTIPEEAHPEGHAVIDTPGHQAGRSWRGKAAALGIGLAISVVLLEVSVRSLGLARHLLTDPAFEATGYPGVPFRYKPNFVGVVQGPTEIRTNSSGCRDRDYPLVRAPGTVRIVVMGDSVTFGQAVAQEETYPKLLERWLSERLSPRTAEVINLGVQAYTVRNQVSRFLAEARRYRPDVAILAPITDDLDLMREMYYVDEKGYLTKSVLGQSRLKSFLRQFHAVYLVKGLVYAIASRSGRYSGKRLTVATLGERLDLIEAEVGRFVVACGEDGTVPVFALLDLELNIFTESVVSRLRGRFPSLAIVDCSWAFQGIPVKRLIVPRDGHPNAAAHQIMAEQLREPVLRALTEAGR